MRALDAAFVGCGILALLACIYYIRQRLNSARAAIMGGLVFLNAAELALHRLPLWDMALFGIALSLILIGLAMGVTSPRRPQTRRR